MKLAGTLACLAFLGCAATPTPPAASVTESSAASMPATTSQPAAKPEPVKAPELAPAPEESEETIPNVVFTPENELRANTRAKLEGALKAIKGQTSASSVQAILTRSLGKPTWIEDDSRRIWSVNDTTQCVRLVLQADGSVELEKMRSTESKPVSRTARQNLCSGKIERDE